MPAARAACKEKSMTTSISVGKHEPLHVEIRHVSVGQALEWLRYGWHDVKTIGRPGLAHGVLIALLGAVLLMLGSSHFYLTAAAVTGYLLVGPVMTAGLCELARRRDAREKLGFDESLRALGRNPEGLMHFAGVLALVGLVWFILSAILLDTAFKASVPSLAVALWGGAESIGAEQLLGYVACGAVLAALVFAVSVVAVPLIIDRHASAGEAIRASVRATFANLPAMLVWSALIVAVTAIGFITLLIGMVWVAPLLGYATWHAYRDLVG
jgi:uncharacterized membrane protein